MKRECRFRLDHPGKAFITGASSGLGAAFAKRLAACGFNLVLLARRGDRLRSLADQLEAEKAIRCDVIEADLSAAKDVEAAAEAIRRIDDLDVLVNSAGFATLGYFADIPVEKSMRMFSVHMSAPLQFCHAAIPNMRKRGRGFIINVSSLGAFSLTPGNVIYDSTKAFLNAFSENLSLETQKSGIIIQSLCPGFTKTEFHSVGDLAGFNKAAIPASFWMTPEDVVLSSLNALQRNRKVIFIPGWKNRLYKWSIQHSRLLNRKIQARVGKRDLGKDQSEGKLSSP